MIRYAIYKVLTKHFAIYSKTDNGWNLLVYYGDLYDVYSRVLATDNFDLEGYDSDLDKELDWKRWEIQANDKHEIVINRPTSAEDIINLFGDKWDLLKQNEKFKVIAERYKCSTRTAERLMAQFGLCQTAKRKAVKVEKRDNETAKLLARIEYLENRVKQLEEENKQLKEDKKQGSLFQTNDLDF